MKEVKYKNAGGDIVSQLIGDEGLKTSITIKVDALSITAVAAAMIIALIAANVATHYIMKALK